jgi:15-cis-phytoene desaturase
MKQRVIIVGSGLAAMSAAVELARRGIKPVIFEKFPFLGGRTSSWSEDGMPTESGLHRVLGFYEAFPDLIRKVGLRIDEIVQWEDELEIRLPDGTSGTFGAAPLHRPLHTLAGALRNFHLLGVTDRLSLGRFFTAGLVDYAQRPEELDHLPVLEFAHRHGVTDRAIEALLVPLTSGIFFVPPERYSTYALFGLIGPYLGRLHQVRIGAFRGGMSDVLIDPMARYLERYHEAEIHRGEAVAELIVDKHGHVTGVATGKREYKGRAVVLAASLAGAKSILGRSFPRRFTSLHELPAMPVVTFQLELSEPAMAVDHTTFGPGTCWASFAEQSRTTFPHTAGRLSIILTPPEEFVDMPADQILKRVIADGRRLGIDISKTVERYRKVTLPMDFYSLEPGYDHLRPPQTTGIPGLFLAGDYTRQPYLGTMEGAVVSGRRAAAAISVIMGI